MATTPFELSMPPIRICVVTSSRADFGLLRPVMDVLKARPADFDLKVIATGTHLSPAFGNTWQEIAASGFKIDERVEILLASDTPIGISKTLGLATMGLAEAYGRVEPDFILLLGDRYEILGAAQAAMVANIPIAHLCGGDKTEGAIDDAIRHSITKMSQLHFVTNELAMMRVRQLGENETMIFNVGSPGIDAIMKLNLLTKTELSHELSFEFKARNFLVTFHPVTLGAESSQFQMQELLSALELFVDNAGIIFTYPNADTDGQIIIDMIENFCLTHNNARAYKSLGQLKYFSAIKACDVVIGNSSSGLYEVPSFAKPTVNIGDRQKGRLKAMSVTDTPCQAQSIVDAIQSSLSSPMESIINPYGDGHSSARISDIIMRVYREGLLRKSFVDLVCE